ncbi:hypothetical protein ACLOJK_024898 [Asimina triloba]
MVFWLAVSRLPKRSLSLLRRSVDGVWFHSSLSSGERSAILVRASSDMDAKEPDITNMPRESAEEAPSVVESLPLESKQQLILEQRQKMKLAKKIRLRRKRLLRKRKMRKKGRWPPSKMKKLKNELDDGAIFVVDFGTMD